MAKLIECERGHYYDGMVYQSCPYCIPHDPDSIVGFPVADDDWCELPPKYYQQVEILLNPAAHQYCMSCLHKWKPGESQCPECGADYPEKYISFGEMPPGIRLNREKYLLGSRLASGKSGFTYLGLDLETEKRVVIKELCPKNSVDRDYSSWRIIWRSLEDQSLKTQLFEREIEALRVAEGLPYVVSLYDWFQENDTCYLVMPCVGHVKVREIENHEPDSFNSASWRKIMGAFQKLAEALHAIHERGIIHCDLSPDNLLLDEEGNIWAVDFGSARRFPTTEETAKKNTGELLEGVVQLTQNGGFSAPELSCGIGTIGPWTDVYSLCAVMLYLYTNREPPHAADRFERDTIDKWFIEVPADIRSVLSRGLSLKTEARFQTMAELAEALAQISYDAPFLYPVYTVGDSGDPDATVDMFFHYCVNGEKVTLSKYAVYDDPSRLWTERVLRFMPTVEGRPITSVGDGAFAGCSKGLHGVILPDTIRNIGAWAFFHCTWLKQFRMPDSVLEMGEGCFYGCNCLSDITLSHGLSIISAYCFHSCTSLTVLDVPNSVTKIGNGAFIGCGALVSIALPDTLTTIGEGAFIWCVSLTTISIPEGVTAIRENTFKYCNNMTSITFPAALQSIGENAFLGCNRLKKVYYGGTKSQWEAVSIELGNENLTCALVVYNS